MDQNPSIFTILLLLLKKKGKLMKDRFNLELMHDIVKTL